MLIKPYYSLDIETTGLDIAQAQVLSIALVFDDGKSAIEDLKYLELIVHPTTDYYEYYAMAMHSELLKILAGRPRCTTTEINNAIAAFIGHNNKIPIAGKNVAGFDLPILQNNNIKINAHHRTLDVGSLYFHKFGYVPSLDEINKLLGFDSVSHKALDDALNIVKIVRSLQNG